MKRIIFLLTMFILSAGSLSFLAQDIKTESEKIILYEPLKVTVKNYFSVQNTSKREAVDVLVTILVGQDDSIYQVNITGNVTPEPIKWNTDDLGNYYAIHEFPSIKSGEKKEIIVSRTSVNYAVSFDDAIWEVKGDYSKFTTKDNKKYLLPSVAIESADPLFISAAQNFDKNWTVMERVYGIFSYINTGMTYDTNPLYANTSALNAIKTMRGVCTEFSGAFVAICRANGIPARIVSGYWPRKDLREGIEELMMSDDRHSWAEFYVPDYGWVPVEPSSIYTHGDVRQVSNKDFAAILPTSRHFIYSYGLDKEREGNIAVNYSYYGEESKEVLITVDLFKESIILESLPTL